MTRTAWIWLCIATLVLGCSGRMVGGEPDAGGDASITPSDGGRDAGDPVDGGTDAATPDAGPPDAGPPPCGCPAFPEVCAAPLANVPAFTPDAAAVLGQLFDVIACADTTLQIAMYEAEWPCIGAALQTALERDADLTVEVVVDDDRCAIGSCLFDTLPPDRVSIVRDSRSAYMHHKWVIADGSRAWIGSTNFSERSFCVDHNNSVVVDQTEIVDAYEALFAEMSGGSFGPIVRDPLLAPPYTLYVSPESPTTLPADWQNDIIAAIDAAGAGSSIDVMMNAWTVEDFATAIIAARDRGATVRVLVSSLYAGDAPAQALLSAGVEIRRGNIHDKVIVIDDVVFTGSANWSVNARTNSENVLRIDDATAAAAYHAEAGTVFASARTLDAAP